MKIKLAITKREYQYYLQYCKLFGTNINEDLTAYVKARAEETETYIKKNGLDSL